MTQTDPDRSEFWSEQARALALDLEAIAAAFLDLSARLPRAIQQAADLGLMREQHDAQGFRTALRGDIALNAERDVRVDDLAQALARLEARLDALARAEGPTL